MNLTVGEKRISLLEMIVVVALIACLAAVLLPGISSADPASAVPANGPARLAGLEVRSNTWNAAATLINTETNESAAAFDGSLVIYGLGGTNYTFVFLNGRVTNSPAATAP